MVCVCCVVVLLCYCVFDEMQKYEGNKKVEVKPTNQSSGTYGPEPVCCVGCLCWLSVVFCCFLCMNGFFCCVCMYCVGLVLLCYVMCSFVFGEMQNIEVTTQNKFMEPMGPLPCVCVWFCFFVLPVFCYK